MTSARHLAWVFAAVAGAGALAGLLGPSERWGGLDVGATGVALFVLAMGAFVWLLSSRADQVFPEDMSVTERRAWIGLAFLVLVLALFFHHLWSLAEQGVVPERIDGLFGRAFIQKVIGLVIAWSVMSSLVGRNAGRVEADERDLRLRHRADRVGDWAFTLIVIAGICVLASVPASDLAWWLSPIVLANLLIGLLALKSLVEHVALALAYRNAHA